MRSRIALKLVLIFKLDIYWNALMRLFQIAELKRVEQQCGCQINYVGQGFNGVKIASYNGNYSKFYIHPSSHLKSDTFIECSGGVHIGRYFHPGKGLTIFSVTHNYMSDKAIPYDETVISKPVTINDFVWCGTNVTILPGATVGEGAIIGAGSVVVKDIPDYAIAGGNPARVIKYRDIEMFKTLKAAGKML